MHVAAIAISVVVLIAGYVYIFKSINEQLLMQHEINLKLPPEKQFEPRFWWYGTHREFPRLQRELLPESLRPRRLRRFRLIGFALLTSGLLILAALRILGLGT